jgi:hypothetical protein
MNGVAADYICPVSKCIPLTDAYRMKPCGCVVSRCALPRFNAAKEFKCLACHKITHGADPDEATSKAARAYFENAPYVGESLFFLEANEEFFFLRQVSEFNPIKGIQVRKSDGKSFIQMDKMRDDVREFYKIQGIELIPFGTSLEIPGKEVLVKFLIHLKKNFSISDEGEVILRFLNKQPELTNPVLLPKPPVRGYINLNSEDL